MNHQQPAEMDDDVTYGLQDPARASLTQLLIASSQSLHYRAGRRQTAAYGSVKYVFPGHGCRILPLSRSLSTRRDMPRESPAALGVWWGNSGSEGSGSKGGGTRRFHHLECWTGLGR